MRELAAASTTAATTGVVDVAADVEAAGLVRVPAPALNIVDCRDVAD